MTEPCTAQPLPVLVRVNHRDYVWEPKTGLEPAVVEALHAFCYREALRLKGLGALRGLGLEDLVQEGRVGVLEAARRFDPFRGVKFISYAGFWVRQAILAALREQAVRMSPRDHDAMMKVGGLPPVCSLDAEAQGGEAPLWSFLGLDPTQEDDVQAVLIKERVRTALGHLHGRFREVLIRRYGIQGESETLVQIGASWGQSGERVRQIQVIAEGRIRHLLIHGAHA